MDHIFSEIKIKRRRELRKLLSDSKLFDEVVVDAAFCPEYNPDHNLDEGAWFKIDDFSKKDYCLNFLKVNFDSKNYMDLEKKQFLDITYIFSQQGDDFYFQKISPSLFLSKKSIVFGDVAELEINPNRLVVNAIPDAIYFKNIDVLVFRNLAVISGIFKGIDTLFKEATNDEVVEFLGQNFLALDAGYSLDLVSKPNRKRIALAMETLEKMSDADKNGMVVYVNDYCGHVLKFDVNLLKFNIAKDDELKLLLYGIEQRFYTTVFGKEKRLANSVQAI